MTANLDYYNLGSNSLMVQDLTSELAGQEGTVSSGRRVKADNGINIYSAKVDYQTLLWKRVMFEAGAKWALSSTANTTLRQESGLQVFDQTTKFTYDEHVGAAYFNAATSFGGKWSVKAGLRAEYTYSFGDWITVDQETRRSYLNLFPTVFVGYTPSQNWRFTTSYTRRINRPGYMYLNPTESYIDAHTWVVGNPELLPEINDDVMLAVGTDSTSTWPSDTVTRPTGLCRSLTDTKTVISTSPGRIMVQATALMPPSAYRLSLLPSGLTGR